MPRKVSIKQTNVLLKLMEDNTEMASARMISADDLKAFWDEATVALNAPPGGTVKTSNEWRIYWTDLKYRARKRAAAIQNDIILTGGVATSMRPLTSIENRVLAIIKETEGNQNLDIEDPPPPQATVLIKQEKDQSDEEIIKVNIPVINHTVKRPILKPEPDENNITPDTQTSDDDVDDEVDLEPQQASKQSTIRYRRQRIADPRTWARKAEERRMDLEIRRTRSLQLMQRSLHRMENSVGGLVQQIGQAVGCLNRIAQALENMQPPQWPRQ